MGTTRKELSSNFVVVDQVCWQQPFDPLAKGKICGTCLIEKGRPLLVIFLCNAW